MKVCKICSEEKKLSEFYKSSRHKDGHFSHCKECHKDKIKQWPSQSEEESRARVKFWKDKNRERVRQENREYARRKYNELSHRERSAIYHARKLYLERYKASLTDEQKTRYAETALAWARDNSDKVNNKTKRYRARKHGAAGSHTLEEWLGLCANYGWKCLRCGEPRLLTEDHIEPLSKGGSDYIENIQPLCGPCNSAKGVKNDDYRTCRT